MWCGSSGVEKKFNTVSQRFGYASLKISESGTEVGSTGAGSRQMRKDSALVVTWQQ